MKVGEVELGNEDHQTLIDPTLIIPNDNIKEEDINLLKIIKNSLSITLGLSNGYFNR